ncbi:MAG: hypothetical protein AABY40_02580 [Nanoarchaeota archaeon]
MLEEAIINMIIERKLEKARKDRRDSGWQPIPLYDELEIPQPVPSERGHDEIDIGESVDYNVVDNNVVTVIDCYSPKKYF